MNEVLKTFKKMHTVCKKQTRHRIFTYEIQIKVNKKALSNLDKSK